MFDITLPGTSDSKAIDDPVSRLAFPVLTFCNNGCLNLKFRARRKDLERTTTLEVKVGLFRRAQSSRSPRSSRRALRAEPVAGRRRARQPR